MTTESLQIPRGKHKASNPWAVGIRDEIVASVSGKTNCADITTSDLAGITRLRFTYLSFSGGRVRDDLKSGDFAGLTGLTEIQLNDHQLTTLPADIFSGLSALETLRLGNNQLSSLPSGIFAGLTSLTTLNLSGNSLPASLPGSLFADVPRNAITLPAGTTVDYIPTTVGSLADITDLVANGNPQTVDVADKFSDTGDTLTYTVESNNTATVTVAVSGSAITITPVAIGTATITVTATDTAGQTATQTFAATVVDTTPVAVPSISISSATVTATVGTAIANITIDSSGGAVDSYSISPTLTAGLTLDTATGAISGTPTATAPSRTYTITASNSAGTDTAMVTITVNAAPVVNNPAPTIATVLGNIDLAVNAQSHTLNVANKFSDPDDTLTFSVQSDNTATASVAVSGSTVTITPIAIGTTTITVAAADTIGQTVTQTFMVTVISSPLPNPTVCMRHEKVQEVIIQNVHGKSRCEDITAADLAAINSLVHTGGFDFVPPKRSDFAGLTTLLNLDISGNNNFGGLTTLPADLFQDLPALRNLNLTNNQLRTLPIGIFEGLSLIGLTLGGNPWVSFPTNIFEELVGASQHTRNLIIGLAPINAALPVASGTIPAQSLARTANPLTLEVATFFSDPGDTLTYTATSATPAIASVAISGSMLTITPVALGTTNIMVTARDTAGQPVTQAFALTVSGDAAVVAAPNISISPSTLIATVGVSITPITITNNGGAAVSYDITDSDGQSAPLNDFTQQAGLVFNTATGRISGTLNDSVEIGTETYIITATNSGGTDTASVTITVNNVAPIIRINPATLIATVGTPIDTITITNTGGDVVSHIITDSNGQEVTNLAGLVVDAEAGIITGTLNADADIGTAVYTITVINSGGSDSATVTISVIKEALEIDKIITSTQKAPTRSTRDDGVDVFSFDLDENIQHVANITVTGVGANSTPTYSLSDHDSGVYDITQSGVLSFKSDYIPNYEMPRDKSGDRTGTGINNQVYKTVVMVSGGTEMDKIEIRVTIQDVNEAPTITSSNTFTVAENSTNGVIVGDITSQDPDIEAPFNSLTYSITSGNANNAFAISNTGAITVNGDGKIDFETTPSYALIVEVADGGSPALTGTATITINVNDVNEAPTIASTIADITNLVANGNPQTVDVASNFNDPNDTLTFSAMSNNPSIASVSGSTTITITPVAVGSATITVTATDSANQTVTQTFVVSVSNPAVVPNPAPTTVGTITDITNLVANGNPQTVDVASNFNDTDALTFSAMSNNPSIATVSGSTTITITPVAVGTTTITVTATDTANQTVTQTFVVSVSNPIATNPAPTTVGTIADITNLVANGSPQTVDVAGKFNDTDALTFSATSNNPNIASVSGSTTITITPVAVGTTTITVTATDTANQTVTQTFVVSVSNPAVVPNPAPTTVGTIADITNLVANGNPQTVDVAGKFNDTDALIFSAMSNNPNIASVSGSTTITITPLAVGTTTITVTATDTANQTVTQTFVVSVSNPAVVPNPAPTTVGTITDITNLVANGNSQTVDVASNFNDTDALTFSAMSNNPSIATVSGSTTITITPLAAGTTTITVTATDTANQTVTQTFVVSVSNPIATNPAPTTVGTIADITNLVANGNPQTVDVASNFNDTDALIFSATSNNPNIASVSGSTTITITPVAVGTTTITVTATDTANQTVTQTFVVSVSNPAVVPNPAPTTVGTIADITNLVANGRSQTVDVASNFNDTDALTFSAMSNNPNIASVSGSTTITITPVAVGTTTITVTATDTANQTVTQTFVVSVSNPAVVPNPAPTTVGTIADITNLVANGRSQTVDVASNFNDTDALTFSATSNNPSIASVSGSTTITITPLAVGSATITVTATDTANQTVTQTFVVSVSNPIATNPAPTTVGTIADITNLIANGNPQTVDVAGNFNDTDALTFSATSNNPSIASVSGSTTITITPVAVGTTTITVTATDTANQTVTQTFVVSVSNPPVVPNPAPTTVGTIADITNLVANGNPQTVDVADNFNDTDALIFSATSNNPSIASVSGSTTITITPVAAGSATITVTATDTANQTVTQTFVVSVSNPAVVPNPAPTTVGTIADITNLVANGNTQTVDVTSKFNDTDALTFSATSNNPSIASVSGSTTITITPLAVGTTTITVTATDTANQTVTQTFVVSVSNPIATNPAPTTVGTIADITNLVANGNPQTVDVAGKFNDTDALTFSATSNNPSIASVSGSTTITITPLAVGTTTITVTATDTANQTVTQTFVVSVSNPIATNPAPTTVGTIADITNLVANGNPQTVDVTSNFNDTDALTFSATSNNPNIASVSGSTTITITPVAAGSATITVTATDTANQTVTQTFVVSVSNPIATNPAPTTVGTIADITNLVANGNPQTVDVTSNFNDTDALTFSATSNNPSIASVSGSTTITITPVAAGSSTITVTATDTANQTVTQTFVVSVNAVPITTPTAKATESVTVSEKTIEVGGSSITVESRTIQVEVTTGVGEAPTITRFSAAEVSDEKLKTIANKAIATGGIDVRMESSIDSTITPTLVVNTAVDISVDGGGCPAKGCEVTLSYEASDEQGGKDLYVFHYDGAQWEALPHVRRDTINRKVTALATRFSPFALFNVSRADKLAKQLNKDILPNLVQTMLASTMAAVSTRMDAAFSGRPQVASYQFDGQTVQLDSQTRLSVNLHNTVEQKLPTYIKALKDDTLDWKRLIGNSSFVMPLNALDEDGGAGATVWGSGEYINLSDKDWKGNVFNVQLGVDQRIKGDLLAGGLVSWSRGDVDYTLDGERGKYTHRVTSIHPYMARSRDGVNLWGSVGYGQGELSIVKKENNTKRSSGTRLLSLSAGVSGRLTQYGQSGLNLKSDLSLARTNIDDSTDIPADKLSNQRLRLLLEIDKERPLASGGRFNPLVEIGLRYDGGTGESGIGAVLGLGGRYANATGLTFEGKFHTLVGRKDYKEWGVQGVIRQQSGANDQGLTFSLSPSYGATGNSANQVWEQELADGNNRNDDYRARLDVNMGYGLFTSGGLLTPYSELRMGDSNRYRLGLRWKPNSPFNLHLYGERKTGNDSDRILLESHIRF